jgi:hypothetical protein
MGNCTDTFWRVAWVCAAFATDGLTTQVWTNGEVHPWGTALKCSPLNSTTLTSTNGIAVGALAPVGDNDGDTVRHPTTIITKSDEQYRDSCCGVAFVGDNNDTRHDPEPISECNTDLGGLSVSVAAKQGAGRITCLGHNYHFLLFIGATV